MERELFIRNPAGLIEVKTQTPKDLPSLKSRKRELIDYISPLTVEYLKTAYKSLLGKTPPAKPKGYLVDELAENLNFPSEEAFQEWFSGLPSLTQRLLYLAAFTDYVPIRRLEKEYGISLVIEDRQYSWRTEWRLAPNIGLDFLPFFVYYSCPVVIIPVFLRVVLNLWLAPPELSQISACRSPEQPEAPAAPWNNSLVVADAFPLLCDALRGVLHYINEPDQEKIVRGGFKKKDIAELRTSSGFLPFSLSSNSGIDHAPDSVDLAARFIMCMRNFKPRRPDDGQEEIRRLVQAFFSKDSQFTKKWDLPDRSYLEFTICIDHFSRSAGYYLDSDNKLPASRKVFHDILLYIAGDGAWFDADKLAEHIRITAKNFSFCGRDLEKSLRIKAEAITIEGLGDLLGGYSDEFHPEGVARFYLLVRPLFKAYCYIFAALGILEIIQSPAPLVRTYRVKQSPLSPYDSLKAIRVTDLGRWCLGITDSRPPKPSQEYQAIADRELLLVTVQGNSLERRLYLDKIGQRLGEDRWRISPASFIAGCANKRQITERIERFKALIDKNPAPHWERLFAKVLERAGIFDAHRHDMLVYDLPQNQELLEELLGNPELKRIARRVEGRMLVVASRDQKKFYALLNEHGIAHF